MNDAGAHFGGRRVLVTGGLGFIGSNLARRLVDAGADVTLVDSLIPQYGGNPFNIRDIRDRVTVNITDVRDAHAMAYLVQGQDYLFNLAGQTSHLDSMTDPKTDLDINAAAQLSILEACRHRNPGVKVVFASTRQLYGKPEYLPVDEDHPVRLPDPGTPDAGTLMEREERNVSLREAISMLLPDGAAIINLFYLQEQSLEVGRL